MSSSADIPRTSERFTPRFARYGAFANCRFHTPSKIVIACCPVFKTGRVEKSSGEYSWGIVRASRRAAAL